MIAIRAEEPEDRTAVRFVNELAFFRPDEADLVDLLRSGCPESVSFVATDDETVVGHILFTPVTIISGPSVITGMGLGPMAVLPSHQGQGIGSALVRHGLEQAQARGCPFVVVVGHPEYYPRFGFEPASRRGIRSQWPDMADDAFMVVVFDETAMRDVAGVARYRDEFDAVT
jgi:putative acetyltransferase